MPRRHEPLSTQSLILGLAAGRDRDEAWATFVELYGPLMRGWCRNLGLASADAEEVADRVLGRLVEKIGAFQAEKGGLQPWLRAIVENAVRDHRRRERRHPGDCGHGGNAGPDTLRVGPEPLGGNRTVEQLLDGLSLYLDDDYVRAFREVRARHHAPAPSKSWQAYERLCIREQSVAEVAAALSMTPAAVSSAAYRVKSELNAEHDRRVTARGARP